MNVRMVLSWPFVAVIRAYQLTIAPLLGPRCKYHPSCSAYAVDSLLAHGPIKGVLLATWRILRCNPWSLGGLDPTPSRGHWVADIYPDGKPRPTHNVTTSKESAAGSITRVHP